MAPWAWKQSVTYTTYVTHGDRAAVFMVTQDGKRFVAAVAEGNVEEDGAFTEDTHTLIGNRFKSMATAQRACTRYERAWRKVETVSRQRFLSNAVSYSVEPADGQSDQRRDVVAFVEAASPALRAAGVMPQA